VPFAASATLRSIHPGRGRPEQHPADVCQNYSTHPLSGISFRFYCAFPLGYRGKSCFVPPNRLERLTYRIGTGCSTTELRGYRLGSQQALPEGRGVLGLRSRLGAFFLCLANQVGCKSLSTLAGHHEISALLLKNPVRKHALPVLDRRDVGLPCFSSCLIEPPNLPKLGMIVADRHVTGRNDVTMELDDEFREVRVDRHRPMLPPGAGGCQVG
jgi:hypothetical protein